MKPFYLLIVRNVEIDADGQAYYGTDYDMQDACPVCGTGAIAKGPRYMSGLNKKRKGLFQAGYGELLIEEKLAEKLLLKGVEGLAEVYNVKGQKMPFMEIRGEATFPPFSSKTTGYEIGKQCLFCKRDGFFDIPHVPLKLGYENLDGNLPEKNILITYERFGYSKLRQPFKESGFAEPKFIVSEDLKDLFEREKVRGVEFELITVV